MTVHEAYGIPTVEQALRANGLNNAADKYAAQNSRNANDMLKCIVNMFETDAANSYNTIMILWLGALVAAIIVGTIAQFAR